MRILGSLALLSVIRAAPSNSPLLPRAGPLALVKLRVEGLTSTLFEKPILTSGHNVTTTSGLNIHCDRTNNNVNRYPGPTCISALDDSRIGFDGTFSSQFDDIFITTIANTSQTDTQFWGILLDFHFIPVGGCQQQVANGDEVLFAFDAFGPAPDFNEKVPLKLTGPPTARKGKSFTVTVTNGSNGTPLAGASVGGSITDANGHATIQAKRNGLLKLKAGLHGAIRSNAVEVAVI